MDINIIVGPPCAGKSTYIEANSNDGEVLVDFDKIAFALGARESHGADGSIRTIALQCRYTAINTIKSGIGSNAWIIHTNPSKTFIDDYISAGAKFTIIDPGERTCKERADADGRPDGTIEAIEKWYEHPPQIPDEHIVDEFTAITKLIRALLHVTTR